MANIEHKNIPAGADAAHPLGYVTGSDPGAVGASRPWVDTSGGSGSWELKVRDAANTGWEALGGGIAPVTDPTTIANCKLWSRGDSLTATGDTNVPAQWDDESGQANHWTNATAGQRGIVRTAIGPNSTTVLRLDDTDDGFENALTLNTDYTLFAVAAPTVITGSHRLFQGDANNFLVSPTYQGAVQAYNTAFIVGPRAHLSRFVAVCMSGGANGAELWLNGHMIGWNAQTTRPGKLVLGAVGSSAETAAVDVACTIAYDRALTDIEIQSIFLGFRDASVYGTDV